MSDSVCRLEDRVSELELQLQTLDQQKLEAVENMLAAEQKAAELDLQLKSEAQQKLVEVEKVQMLELRLGDLEEHLHEPSHEHTEANTQVCYLSCIPASYKAQK